MFKKIIRIPGKSFRDLSKEEVALMIEADSSLTKGGNEYFSDCALDVFLHGTNLDGMAELQKIQSEILENIYLNIPGERHKKINTEFLMQYAEKLKNDPQSAS
jgi:hypothetical protein